MSAAQVRKLTFFGFCAMTTSRKMSIDNYLRVVTGAVHLYVLLITEATVLVSADGIDFP